MPEWYTQLPSEGYADATTASGLRAEPRIATYCDCGAPVAGFPGVVKCGTCGRLWSLARMMCGRVR